MTDDSALVAPRHILRKIPDTVTIQLDGRQCRIINWVFTDFLLVAKLLPEFPEDLLIACRQVSTFSGLYAGSTSDGHEKKTLTISVLHAHFIAFALTLEIKQDIPARQDMAETVKEIGRAFTQRYPETHINPGG